MTIKEAREQLKDLIRGRESFIVGGSDEEIYRKDIDALKKALELFEKQILKKPLAGIDFMGNEFRICCECSAIVKDGEWEAKYCPDCGQAIDWSDEE